MRRPLKVIVAEDETVSRQVLQEAVVSLGHECRVASNGVDAWRMQQAEQADVILSDWQMPDMDGVELCLRTRVADTERAYTYFIFMTGFDDKEHFLRAMAAGADDYRVKPIDLDELQARLTAAERVVSRHRELAEKNSTLRRDGQASFQLARIDALTEVGNRLRMNEDLEVLWARWKRYGHRCSAALCDIDWFKEYNDHFGHLAGDAVLYRMAQAMRMELRQGDGLYRYGGEEFLVVLPEQSLAEAAHVADRVCRGIARVAIPTVTQKGIVTVSVGVAELTPFVDETPLRWLERIDSALYRAKANGRDRMEIDFPGQTTSD